MPTPLAVPPLTLPAPTSDDVPLGGLSTARGHLPLIAMDVAAHVTGLVATTRVTQTFVNTLDEAIEATYVFPLPDRAAVTTFVATLADRRIVGVLKERQQAREDYDAAIAAGQRAALLEEDRPGVFSAKVGNLRPGETAVVELTLAGPLPYDDDEATFRFPLVVAPRYIPGLPLPGTGVGDGTAVDTDLVPDASRISPPVLLPGHPNPVRLSIEVVVDPAGLALSDLRSSLHAVTEDAVAGDGCGAGVGAAGGATGSRLRPPLPLGGRSAVNLRGHGAGLARCRRGHPGRHRRPAGRRRDRRRRPGTSPSSSTARAPCTAGRWSPPVGPRPGWLTPWSPPTGWRCSPSTTASTGRRAWGTGWWRPPTATGSRRSSSSPAWTPGVAPRCTGP